ncbi:hypothetical protein Tco_0748504 [Tanacetum coccineum]|uniref:Uncharacterized protein n=1 Tax=Tanacetum coccineum TaxID=301880 RepID=A0ABQ4YYS8_9ASTR
MTIHSAISNSSKGGLDEIFRMPIPEDLITDVIRNSEYYQKYMEMAVHKPRQATTVTDEEGGKKKKAPPAGKPKQPAPAKQSKLVKKKTSKPYLLKKIRKGKVMKVRMGKRSDHLVDEEDEEGQPAPEPQVEDDEYNLQRGIQMSLESFQAPVGGVEIHEPVSGITRQLLTPITQDASTEPSTQPQDDTSANVVRDTPSPIDAKTGVDMEKSNSEGDTKILNVLEEQGEDVSNMVALEERTIELDEGQAGSDPGKTHKSRPPPESVLMEEDQARSNPGQSHVVQNPPSSSETLLSMKNLDDAFTFGDQFLNDKPTKEEPGKENVETEVKSMATVPIHQASSSAPPLSTPIIDLTPPKLVSPPVQEPIFTATTLTTTTLPLPPPPPQQSNTIPELATRVSVLEKICVNFEKKNKLQEKTT